MTEGKTIYCIFDTETTGLIDRKKKLDDPSQARIVQLAALLCDEQGNDLEELNLIAKPDGWTVPEFVASIHGLTTEICEAKGVPMPEILAKFNAMKAKCTDRVAYNISFDKTMLMREELAYGITHDSENKTSLCVMEMAKPICKMPATSKMKDWDINTFKPPKLKEAYKYFFGEEFERAHDAMNDVRACKKIFFHIGEMQGWIKSKKPEPLGEASNG
jgi:DNA polymerase-3 subunit epsilon